MSIQVPHTIAFSAALAVLAGGATAATISSVSIVDANDFATTVVDDTVMDGDVSVSVPFLGAFATQNSDGTADVQAGVAGFGPRSKVTSTAQFEQEETNTFGMERDYTLSYELTGQSAEFNFGGFVAAFSAPAPVGSFPPVSRTPATPTTSSTATTTDLSRSSGIAPTNPLNPFGEVDDPTDVPGGTVPITAASFEYIISVNGAEVFNARADALLNGFSPAGLVFDAVSGFTPSSSSSATGFLFEVAPISGSIALGTFGAGETISVTSTLIARAYTSGGGFDAIPVSVNTFSSDPVNLSSIGTLSSVPTTPPLSPIPLPAAGWMLLAAVGGLGFAARRKKT